MKPRLRLKGRVWSCTAYDLVGYFIRGKFMPRVVEIGYGYTPLAAWIDLNSRLYDL
jgi:hypothetical protein